MMVDDIINLNITDFDSEGLGIGHYDSKPVFVDNALPGEEVKCRITRVTKNLAFAENLEILKESENREHNICPYYKMCGGCNIMHMKYEYQLKFKTDLVKRTIHKVSGFDPVVNLCVANPNPYEYRNKIIVPFGKRDGRVISGFYEAKSHNIVESCGCMIEPKISRDIIEYTKELIEKYKISVYDEASHTGLIRNMMLRVTSLNKIMVVLVSTKDSKPLRDMAEDIYNRFDMVVSVYLNINDKKTNVVLQDDYRLLFGEKYLVENINGLLFNVHPNSFLQINHKQCENLYQKAINYANIKESDVVIDAYCGIGSISLNIAKHAKFVYGIEVVKEAVVNALNNMKLNNITNADFLCGKCEDIIDSLVKDKKIDVIVFDPPRKGCDERFLNTVIRSGIKKIVYISCKTSTFARDIKILCDNGYKVVEVTPFDLFSHSVHTECCGVLVKE
ncbi:MAG: 23S rRNA (uracil(1939)-C(5))-methyltransferase RlmD [Acholeplasmatales bacterium]|nr:23S rRNA (uracil(1939)-C(5))-methyltransferase RlmD [Acholeplasmatales bacterium]